MSHAHASAAVIRASLKHPIIDADGHWLEFGPVVREQMRRIGGDLAAEGFTAASHRTRTSLSMTVDERRRLRLSQEGFWGSPSKNTLDRATATFPRLLYQRLDDLGLDFAVLYPTAGLRLHRLPDAAMRRATCRAYNTLAAEYFHDFADRLTPAAVIPMHTPDEAIEELEHVTRQLGLKVGMFGSLARRLLPEVVRLPDGAPVAEWYDTLGLDSEHDYDPVWRRCQELGISPTFHTGARWQGFRMSPTNFTYNHIGHFATGAEAVCKALFLGGVTRRFPDVNFAFLEGGVGWACMLYADLIGHWEKRNRKALEHTDPRALDHQLLLKLAEAHATGELLEGIRQRDGKISDGPEALATGGIADLDDYAACRIETKSDLRDLFVPRFWFGCEADDRVNAWAFNRRANPFDARLNAIFGSDIGHFDVPDMADVVPEAWELVEDELMTTDDFRDFTFANAVRLWGTANPGFFKGTVVEKAAAEVLAPSR